ncbi:hypothetical protein SAMN04487906_2689 [Zhouia amylolytica]|uniref:Serine aminopeptidase S33 domain-containing protein n=1 Tax=Zhouia amylolytica TaxID=376730 RepID=A0A1I6UWT4_9FLAO|nr:alpha/beta hydrolase [Zhouia amylolytica]MCQ0110187.1 alpha/beta hydrolase [Zhouia amylolytica]SFT05875.1 hypothetical protein SAMN04487906_2689 [Zhouia amylolytica]
MKQLVFYICLFTNLICQSQDIKQEEVALYNDNIALPGTLSYPGSNEKMPLAIFIHGSGNVDRNGNQKLGTIEIKANYIKLLADSLNARGIAFYRYDKRTSIAENIKLMSDKTVFEDLVTDVKVIIDYFKKDKRFTNITLIGHSQGSLTAMLAQDTNVTNYISLAGPSEDFETLIMRQINAQSAALSPTVKAHFEELKKTDTILNVNPYLVGIFAPANHHFLKSYIAYKPLEEIKNVKARTLIIQGDADIQVRIEDAKNLFNAKPDADLRIIKDMNHVLKEVHTLKENNESYYSANFALASELVETITEFINK